jgi:hypothetical protein
MGYRLQMSAEIYDWLADLRDSDPPAAILVVRALATLAEQGGYLGLPLVAMVDGQVRPAELASAMEVRYQAWLRSLAGLRREQVEAAQRKEDLERQLAEPGMEPAQAAALRQSLATATREEGRLNRTCRTEQLRADTFLARKEILRAALLAAQAEAVLDPARTAARLGEITSMIEPELDLEPPAEGLLELRPGAPAESGIRILFAVDPPGTAQLIAVLEGEEAIRDHYHEAILLASEALREIRDCQFLEADEHTFADARSLLAELLP